MFLVTAFALNKAEFPVLSELDFYLSVPTSVLLPQFTRILTALDSVPLEYLGEETYEQYFGELMDSGLGQANTLDETIAETETNGLPVMSDMEISPSDPENEVSTTEIASKSTVPFDIQMVPYIPS